MRPSDWQNLQSLTKDTKIEDIVLHPSGTHIYQDQQWVDKTETHGLTRSSLESLKNAIAEETHQALSVTQPTVDSLFTLEDGSRFRAHIAIEPLVAQGPQITLRRLPLLSEIALEDFEISEENKQLILSAVAQRQNILIAGATGAGKTRFLCALLKQVPSNQRMLLLEDSPELPQFHSLCVSMQSRHDRFTGKLGSTWQLSDLVFECLRMRPDRIIVGECRSHEAAGLKQAMSTGHSGCMTTIHAGSPQQAMQRFEELAGSANESIKTSSQSSQWQLVLQLGRTSEGRRCVKELWAP